MLEFVNIKNFKTLLDASFPLSSLNIFSGLNGMGKSSLIQCLLLLRQSYEKNLLEDKGLLLNGEYVDLGVSQDVLSISSEVEEISFRVKWSEFESVKPFEFFHKQNSELLPSKTNIKKENFENLSLFNTGFHYLSAERLGPQSQHEMSDYSIKTQKALGSWGEYTVHYIAEYGSDEIELSELQHPKAVSKTLLSNIEAWMSDITPGLKVRAVADTRVNSATLGFVFQQGKDNTRTFRPQNVGFGLSYVLPIITSILSSKKGDLRIIENPESHLHPAGQSIMGKLCALAAKAGLQLIVESHSDHFLNGVRVAVKEKMIFPHDVNIYFLQRDMLNEQHASDILALNIDEDGRLDCWPNGFCDEWDKQLERLL